MPITVEQIAQFYDKHNIEKGDRGWMKRERIIAQLKPFIKNDILEIGCGTGIIAKEMCNLSNVKSYTAIDLSSVSIEKAKETPSKVLFETADFMEWQTDKKFDCICFFDSLEHFFDWQKTIEKASELLNSHASKVILNIPNPQFTKYCQEVNMLEHIIDKLIYLEDLIVEFKKYHKDIIFYHLYMVEFYKQYQFLVFQ